MNRKTLPKWTKPLTDEELRHAKEWLCDGRLSQERALDAIEVNKQFAEKHGTTLAKQCWLCSSIDWKLNGHEKSESNIKNNTQEIK